ncbi:MAG: hypothetical protein H6Q85_1299, partial [candidate division NC10 bacterium]|nr:hypothetical protein [candidate division NC10 bacterium]
MIRRVLAHTLGSIARYSLFGVTGRWIRV